MVDNFETAIRRDGHDGGYIIAFSFTRGAYDEVTRAKTEQGLNMRLVTVKEVLLSVRRPGDTLGSLGPQPEGKVLPLSTPRAAGTFPTAEEPVASDRSVS